MKKERNDGRKDRTEGRKEGRREVDERRIRREKG